MKKIGLCLFVLLAACAPLDNSHRNELVVAPRDVKSLDDNALIENVMIKGRSEAHIAYKYKNVRVDQVAKLAARYCHEKKKNAYLQEVVLDKENYRIATFECVLLDAK